MRKNTKPYQTLSSKVFKQTSWSTFKHDTFVLPNGKTGNYYYVHSAGVFIIPILPDGKIILLKQYRYLIKKQSYEFPGGGMIEGRSSQYAALKELEEETGYKAKKLVKAGKFCPLNGVTDEITEVFVASQLKEGNHQREETEDIDMHKKSFNEIEHMIEQGEIIDGQTIASWVIARKHILKLLNQLK